jgi:hypothetical protein
VKALSGEFAYCFVCYKVFRIGKEKTWLLLRLPMVLLKDSPGQNVEMWTVQIFAIRLWFETRASISGSMAQRATNQLLERVLG